jgi:hypothetical protein
VVIDAVGIVAALPPGVHAAELVEGVLVRALKRFEDRFIRVLRPQVQFPAEPRTPTALTHEAPGGRLPRSAA